MSVCPTGRERSGHPKVKSFFFLQEACFCLPRCLLEWKTVQEQSGEQCVCLCVSKGEGSSISVSSAHMATYGLTKTENGAILSLDVI